MFSCSFVFGRRTARVIISAPASFTAASIRLREYFPEVWFPCQRIRAMRLPCPVTKRKCRASILQVSAAIRWVNARWHTRIPIQLWNRSDQDKKLFCHLYKDNRFLCIHFYSCMIYFVLNISILSFLLNLYDIINKTLWTFYCFL